MKKTILTAAAVVLVGCATQPAEPVVAGAGAAAQSATAPGEGADSLQLQGGQQVSEDTVCRMEKRTGSNVRERRCYSRKELVQMSEEARDFMRTKGTRGAVYKSVDSDEVQPGKKKD